ncbi:CGGC domain-containing protein [Dehalobacter sp. DCM]|uniref:CGGC domain-containing protein n=1 Tax=Dehalobacter sp. DCM TaxID=2907827 RepID=UPI003081C4F1|nr:CGGC domain-containing protein [Dehalobacter sp. DCM]
MLKKIGIVCCSKVTQKMGCSSAQCLGALKNRIGSFSKYQRDEEVRLVGLINCPGCPSEDGTDSLALHLNSLMAYKAEEIHFSSCVNKFCAFRYDFQALLERDFPQLDVLLDIERPHWPEIQIANNGTLN